MHKTLLGLAGATFGAMLMTSVSSTSAEAACGEVTITEMNWASSAVVTAVSKFIMEQGYGCSVTKVPSATLPAVTSVAETGKPDIVTELWINSAPVYKELEAEGKVVKLADVLSDGGVEAWFVPNYLIEKHPELATLEGILANPALVGGKFHNCPVGWGCRVINDNNITARGLRDVKGLEVFDHGSGETMATSIAAAYSDKAPWFGYYWAPTSVLGKYPMTAVDIGPYDADAHTCNTKDDCASPKASSYPPSEVITFTTTAFKESNPDIAALMSNVSFTNAQMGEVLAWQEDNKASADEAAVYFLNKYKDAWSGWLNDEAKGKLAALLNG
ncbi:MAG: ABC transporter substrate-binding protein [Hyphomicrobiales bacterium]